MDVLIGDARVCPAGVLCITSARSQFVGMYYNPTQHTPIASDQWRLTPVSSYIDLSCCKMLQHWQCLSPNASPFQCVQALQHWKEQFRGLYNSFQAERPGAGQFLGPAPRSPFPAQPFESPNTAANAHEFECAVSSTSVKKIAFKMIPTCCALLIVLICLYQCLAMCRSTMGNRTCMPLLPFASVRSRCNGSLSCLKFIVLYCSSYNKDAEWYYFYIFYQVLKCEACMGQSDCASKTQMP